MVPKHKVVGTGDKLSFRAVLFRMVPKHNGSVRILTLGFRAVLFRMVPKLKISRKVS